MDSKEVEIPLASIKHFTVIYGQKIIVLPIYGAWPMLCQV